MKVIGLTGPTGAGKTTVLAALEELDCLPIDCDRVYHRLLDTSPALVGELTDRFGRSILDSRGKLSRPALGRTVFGDPQALLALNTIAHRYVRQEVAAQLDEARAAGRTGAVIDAIALIESGLCDLCAVTAAVLAPPEVRLRRIMARDGISREYALARIQAQPPEEFYRAHCSIILENDGQMPQSALREQVIRLFRPILQQ